MIEKGCDETCGRVKGFNSSFICKASCKGLNKWQRSELYTAYLQEVERADKAEKSTWDAIERFKNELQKRLKTEKTTERFRQALNCPDCWGTGQIIGYNPNLSHENTYSYEDCATCATIRKEAREG